MLRNNNLQPSEYENAERDRMIADTLRNMIDTGVQVSDDEARHAYNLRNERIGLRYVEIPFSDFTAKISPTESQIADYYKKNAEQFREPERVKLVYVHYEPLVLAAKYTPPDKEIQDYYNRNAKTRFTHLEQVHARHILIAVPAGATDKEKAAAKSQGARSAQAGAIGGRLRKAGGEVFGRSVQQAPRRRPRDVWARPDDQAVRRRGVRDEAGTDHDGRDAASAFISSSSRSSSPRIPTRLPRRSQR